MQKDAFIWMENLTTWQYLFTAIFQIVFLAELVKNCLWRSQQLTHDGFGFIFIFVFILKLVYQLRKRQKKIQTHKVTHAKSNCHMVSKTVGKTLQAITKINLCHSVTGLSPLRESLRTSEGFAVCNALDHFPKLHQAMFGGNLPLVPHCCVLLWLRAEDPKSVKSSAVIGVLPEQSDLCYQWCHQSTPMADFSTPWATNKELDPEPCSKVQRSVLSRTWEAPRTSLTRGECELMTSVWGLYRQPEIKLSLRNRGQGCLHWKKTWWTVKKSENIRQCWAAGMMGEMDIWADTSLLILPLRRSILPLLLYSNSSRTIFDIFPIPRNASPRSFTEHSSSSCVQGPTGSSEESQCRSSGRPCFRCTDYNIYKIMFCTSSEGIIKHCSQLLAVTFTTLCNELSHFDLYV